MKGKTIALIVVALIVVVGLGLVSKYVTIKNTLVELEENTKRAWAQVESVLQRRMDLIPNLVETVKGYAEHEKGVFTEVAEARAKVGGAQTVGEKIQANNQLTSALSRLLLVVERYPDLKANQNFLALQDELAGTENRIAVERKRYNDAAGLYNSTRRKIPYSFFASGFSEAPYYKAEEGAKTAPKVKF